MNTPLDSSAYPRVSIIMPTYNQAEYLPAALDGIFHQTYPNIELIVVNDGSTDKTAEILNDYYERYSFTLIHQTNQKLPRALNAGFGRATGEYLTWTSSDNITLPLMIETLVDELDRHPRVGLVYADWEIIDERGKPMLDVHTLDYDAHTLMRMNYINACFLYRRECQDTLGLYDPDYYLAEDWEYWARISRRYSMRHVSNTLYQYRIHGKSLTKLDVITMPKGKSIGYLKLEQDFRQQPLQWFISKMKWLYLNTAHRAQIDQLRAALVLR